MFHINTASIRNSHPFIIIFRVRLTPSKDASNTALLVHRCSRTG